MVERVVEGQMETPDGVKPPLPAWAGRKGSNLLQKAGGKLFSTCVVLRIKRLKELNCSQYDVMGDEGALDCTGTGNLRFGISGIS